MKSFKIIKLLLLTAISIINLHGRDRTIPVDTVVVTDHSTTIRGVKIQYTASTGTQPVWNDSGTPVATLHYTYYKRSDVSEVPNRPLLISFNGGPGSGSVWMHIAYTGPNLLKIDDEGFPVQPYGFDGNPYSVLDVADIVYINPANTGYSRLLPSESGKNNESDFFGIRADIKYLAEWINTFVTRNNRWTSPKFLIGESYGGQRVSGLALELQNKHWMYLNGVILVSPADYNIYYSDTPISSGLSLPYYTAAAWYHKMLPDPLQQKDLTEILPEAEAFTINTLIPALLKGGALKAEDKKEIAIRMAYYSGLSEDVIIQHNLDVPSNFFWKELLRDESGHTIGRLDSRYLGMDKIDAGTAPDYPAELTSWLHSFTPAINHYFRNHLEFITDTKYNMFGPVQPWNTEDFDTREDLRLAMHANPYLKVMYQVGYYDGATTYFHSKYSMWQLDPGGLLKDRLLYKAYRSGHMMYLRKEDLKSASEDLRSFIIESLPGQKPARY